MIDYFIIEKDEGTIGVFRDNLSAEKLKAEYSDNLKKEIKGHTQEFYDERKEKCGVIVRETNLKASAEEIFTTYKKRRGIETYYDEIKNDIDFEALGIQNYHQIQGLAFIMMITRWIWRVFHDKIKSSTGKIKKFSMNDILIQGSCLKMIKYYGKWEITNASLSNSQLFNELGVKMVFS